MKIEWLKLGTRYVCKPLITMFIKQLVCQGSLPKKNANPKHLESHQGSLFDRFDPMNPKCRNICQCSRGICCTSNSQTCGCHAGLCGTTVCAWQCAVVSSPMSLVGQKLLCPLGRGILSASHLFVAKLLKRLFRMIHIIQTKLT